MIALIASNITKSWPAYSVVAGSPASLKPDLSFYRPVSIDEQWSMMIGWVNEIAAKHSLSLNVTPVTLELTDNSREKLIFARRSEHALDCLSRHRDATVCCVETKRYEKRFTDVEHRVLKALAGNRARFLADSDSRL
jgi:hypothetical protein